ncbi:MAG TPA: BON domain-containing protein, partial [Blastocatellia bacterium]|nr:BON domain-containing protein [Blastocatellia bacterium]
MKRTETIIASLILLLVAIANTVNAAPQRKNERRSNTSQSSTDRVRSYLAREIRHELIMLPYYGVFDWLQFEVGSDGRVTLQGQVTRPTLKSDAENVVKNIEGVTKVNNEIEVLPLSPNDDRIRRAIFLTLFNFDSPTYRYGMGAVPSIHIIVKNGNVTLKGTVDNEGDKNLANVRVNSIPGVFS